MPVALRLGPNDHGRAIAREEFDAAHRQEGHRYELIEGKVYVTPAPNFPHNCLESWLQEKLLDYKRLHPEVMNYLSYGARVIVPDCEAETIPEPDLAAYQDVPLHLPANEVNWDELSPFLVVEVLSEDSTEKDLERNVALYQRVPSIREYWIFDGRDDADRPSLRVYRRRGSQWQKPIDAAPGETYTTRLLPAFTLTLDRRA